MEGKVRECGCIEHGDGTVTECYLHRTGEQIDNITACYSDGVFIMFERWDRRTKVLYTECYRGIWFVLSGC